MISRLIDRVTAARKDPAAPQPPNPKGVDNLLNGPKRPCLCDLCQGGPMPVERRDFI